ncbi:MAG: hypothetical protein ACLUGJ_11660 [Blautia wexlerae]
MADPQYVGKKFLKGYPSGPVRRNPEAVYEQAAARVWVDNFKSLVSAYGKKDQYYIQTWHSSLGLKKNEQDAQGGWTGPM